jgi:hypothetical protein
MAKQIVYLVIRSDGEIRAAKRPRISSDEIAVAVTLNFPSGWGKVTQQIEIQMPEPPEVVDAEGQVANDG